ncbi:MAG: thiamine biosynthesis protein [Desulfurivibrionaceae bacterium]|nr:thiamine biosynthesis protein [Desulfurivibrionaceae bacterium]
MTINPAQPGTAVALFSGGLDSILACRLVMAQGIMVKAVRFVTPFFGYELLAREEDYRREVAAQFGIDVQLRDLSEKYLAMLRNPAHGYGKNFNPCVDCKILIASETRLMMEELGASFMISGEVLGQRPMSQRRDTLRIIEKASGCEGILLRPLCALNLPETIPEKEGTVDRGRLLAFRGRTRQPQIALAASMQIDDFPSPAGGCMLTDPNRAGRVRKFYEENETVAPADILLLTLGRQFHLPAGGWLVLGRNEGENALLAGLLQPGDIFLWCEESWPGPSAVLRRSAAGRDLEAAVELIKGYSKKGEGRERAVVLWQLYDG